MDSSRKIAIAVGVLFIIATVAGVSQFPFLRALNASDYLSSVSAHGSQVMTAVLLDLIMIGAVFAIPVVLFPILKKHSEGLARGYVVARIFEAAPLVVGVFSTIALLTLSQEFVAAGAPAAPHYPTLGALLLATSDWTLLIGGQVILSLSALILNYGLFRSRPKVTAYPVTSGTIFLVAYVVGSRGSTVVLQAKRGADSQHVGMSTLWDSGRTIERLWQALLSTAPTPPRTS